MPAPGPLPTLSDPAAIRAAMRLFDELGGIDAFIAAHPGLGLEPSSRYFIAENGRYYDAAPVCAVAFGIQHPGHRPMTLPELAGASARLKRFLQKLGFTVSVVPHPTRTQAFPWTREETVLVADLYLNVLDRRRSGPTHPAVVALSTVLRRAPWHDPQRRQPGFRSPASVAAKLNVLQQVDPDRDPLPSRLPPSHELDRQVLLEFRRNPAALAAEAASLRSLLAFPSASVAPEVAVAIDDTERATGRPMPGARILDLPALRALRSEALRRAVAWLESQGWSAEEVSASQPYDVLATRGPVAVHVFVKGTSGAGSDVLLTAAEVQHANGHYPDTALFVVHSLRLVHDPSGAVAAVRGDAFVVRPWRPADGSLSATGWCHAINPTTVTNIL